MVEEPQGAVENSLLELGQVVLHEHTVDQVLALVVDVAERLLTDAIAVSITLCRENGPYTPHSTAAIAVDLDHVQYDTDRGPCLQALRTGRATNEPAAAVEDEWPELVEVATARGVESFMSLPLAMAGDASDALGALNVYGRKPEPFAPAGQELAEHLARHASVVIANAIAFADAKEVNVQLREALDTRDLIGQAKGILMERESCSSERAFDILRRASQRTNRKLRDIAQELIDSVERNRGPA